MKILLVEDDRKLARALTNLLEEDGHAVEVAHDGERGLELGRENKYDIVVLDVMLPLLDGVEVCRTLRANEIDTPILMLTARTAVPDRVQGLDAGADDYLAKPFAFRELMARLRALTRRQVEAREGYRLEKHGIELDLLRRRAQYGGQTVELSPTEFALLEVLMRNEGRVLTQTQILDHVWGYESWPESNLVPVYVTYLRRKFKRFAIPIEIRSVRGVGYVLGV
ncbi:MAG TPA: response regulator transcription factor [Dehalococcoidia bacterium]|nr:response regulator transcription factor [Dehalococcoidia bacterium]